MYGSPEVHARNLTQARGYVNRFGPGVIVYWFGQCVEGEEVRTYVYVDGRPRLNKIWVEWMLLRYCLLYQPVSNVKGARGAGCWGC